MIIPVLVPSKQDSAAARCPEIYFDKKTEIINQKDIHINMCVHYFGQFTWLYLFRLAPIIIQQPPGVQKF